MTDNIRIAAAKAIQEAQRKDAEKYFYGCKFSDNYLLRNPESLPRYGHLVRKAMMHYGREKYNPHKHGLFHELYLRRIFHDIITHKVFFRVKEYDWEFIDNMLRSYIGGQLGINHSYDQGRIAKGYIMNGQPLPDIFNDPGIMN